VDGTLALHILDDLGVELSLLGDTHLRCKGGGWLPLGGCTWSSLLHHAVDLLERQALGLGDEDVGVDQAKEAKRAPDEEDFCAQIGIAFGCTNHVRCNDGNDAVPAFGQFEQGIKSKGNSYQSQLDAVDRATPRDRIGSGKISPITTQAAGPHVVAKKKM